MHESAGTAEAILESAHVAIARFGLQRVTLEDVARDAGVTRQTVHRHYGTKRQLLAAVMEREMGRFLAELRQVVAEQRGLIETVARAVACALDYLSRHPVFQRMLQTEPETLALYLASDAGPALKLARAELTSLVTRHRPELAGPLLDRAADAIVRLVLSYGFTPARASHEELGGQLATLFCQGLCGAEVARPPKGALG